VLLVAMLLATAHATSAAAEPYRIGAGDTVDVQVWREPDLSGVHRVDESGNLRHVLAEVVPAAGFTCDELAAELRARLERDYLREARVIVSLESSARRRAWILGAVQRPGSYPVADRTRLLDLVFAAGGVREDADGRAEFSPGKGIERDPDLAPIAFGGTGERVDIDLAALLAGDLTGNLAIAAGDVVVVSGAPAAVGAAAAPRRVRVVGEVARPGSYELAEAPTILDAVLAAGGFTEYASANRSRLVRGEGEARTDEKIRLGDIVEGRAGAANIELRPDDLIVIPESFF
jgi:polysaccharide export outer membrane protein